MTASYPASVKTFTRKRDLLDIVLAADINLVYDEVTAMQTVMGTFPAVNLGWDSGTFDQSTLTWPNVRARIQNIEYGLFQAFNDRVKSSGGSTLTPASAATIGLTIKAAASQSANLFEARTALNVAVTTIDAAGMLRINNNEVISTSATQTLTNKTISGTNNTLTNISPSSVIVTGTTDIQEYVEARPTIFYQDSAPSPAIPGTIWVDSSDNVEPFDASALLLKSDPSPAIGIFGYRRVKASTLAPTSLDGADGDIWLQYV